METQTGQGSLEKKQGSVRWEAHIIKEECSCGFQTWLCLPFWLMIGISNDGRNPAGVSRQFTSLFGRLIVPGDAGCLPSTCTTWWWRRTLPILVVLHQELFSRFSLQSGNAERYMNPRKGDSLHPVSKWEPPQIQWKWSGNAIESWYITFKNGNVTTETSGFTHPEVT